MDSAVFHKPDTTLKTSVLTDSEHLICDEFIVDPSKDIPSDFSPEILTIPLELS